VPPPPPPVLNTFELAFDVNAIIEFPPLAPKVPDPPAPPAPTVIV
jgi:hypothetical protein